MLSLVVPMYNEEKTVTELHGRIVGALTRLQQPFEIIFVNDGSTDKTEDVASRLTPLRLFTFRRNYGQTSAIDLGIHMTEGDVIVLLDADLQNDPAEIQTLLTKLNEGYDVVIGRRSGRKDPVMRLLFSRFANWCARILLKVPVHDFGCGLKVYRAEFIKNFRLWGDSQVFLAAVAQERGARITEVPVTFHPRVAGFSKIRISRMLRGAFDLLSIVFFVRYFSKPLRFFGGWGVFFGFLAFIAFASSLYLRFAGIKHITETPLPTVGTLFAILGVLLFMMGLLAEVLLRIYYDNPLRSPYLVKPEKKNE